MRKTLQGKKSFTLIELLVVIAIIGLLSSTVIVNLRGARERAKRAQTLQFSQSIYHSLGSEAVGYWPFDNNNNDSSGYGSNGTWYGSGASGSHYSIDDKILGVAAGQFNGIDDYVNCGNGANLDVGNNDFTVEFWAKSLGSTNGRGIVAKGSWSNIGYFISYAYSPADGLYFGIRDSAGYKSVAIFRSSTFDWTHIVGIKTNNHLEVWVDGVKKNQYDGAIGLIGNPTLSLSIGKSSNGYYFNGFIDEVRIYSKALTSAQIQQHYAEGSEKYEKITIK